MIELSLTKKVAKYAIGVGLSFSWDTIGIERIIEDKIVRLWFLSYSIDTNLPFKKQNFNLWVEGFFCLFFYKKNKQWKYNHYPWGGKIYMYWGALSSFSFIETIQIENYPWISKNKIVCKGIFVVFKWLPHPGARVWHVCQIQMPWFALDF